MTGVVRARTSQEVTGVRRRLPGKPDARNAESRDLSVAAPERDAWT
jgi:hypothetical protein